MTRRRLLLALRIAAWAAVGACVLIFAHKLDWTRVIRTFEGADLGLALAATLAGVPALALQGLRWSSLVKGIRRVPRSIPVTALFVGQAASVFLPMRAGEAVRTELLARATGLGRATALGTVALDHSVTGVVMFTFAAFLPALLPVPRWVAAAVWVGMAGAIGLVLTLLWLAKHPESVPSGRIAHAVAHARSGLMAARNPKAVAEAATFSALAWCLEICTTLLVLSAFHLPHDLPHAMGVIFGVNLALAIPSPPAALGNFELGAGTALVVFGGDPDHATAFAIGLHAMQLLPALVMGGLTIGTFRRPAAVPPPAGAQEA